MNRTRRFALAFALILPFAFGFATAQSSSSQDGASGQPDRVPPAFGTPHPLVIQAIAKDGSWMVGCQARENTDGEPGIEVHTGIHGGLYGDAMKPYFFQGDATGEPIDSFVDSDPAGRWVALIRDGMLTLRDTHTGGDRKLGLPIIQKNPTMSPRSAAFSDDGTKLLYILGPPDQAILRDLATGVERQIDYGAGLLWLARFDGGGAFVALATVTEDTNGNGQLDLPVQRTSLSEWQCRGPVSSYSRMGMEGDRFTWKFQSLAGLPIEGKPAASVPGAVIVSVPGKGGESLRWVSADGTVATISNGPCKDGYQVAAVWPSTRGVLAFCETGSSTHLFDREGAHPIDVDGASAVRRIDTDRIFPVGGSSLLDMKTGTLHKRAHHGELSIQDGRVFEGTKTDKIRVRDFDTGETRTIEIPWPALEGYGRIWGRWMVVKSYEKKEVLVVDLTQEQFVKQLPAMPILMTDDGAVALMSPVGQSGGGVGEGPIVWTSLD